MARTTTRRSFVVGTAAALGSSALPSLAQAPAFPNKPLRYICPWPAGGSTYAVMRALAESAAKTLGQPIIGYQGVLNLVTMLVNTVLDEMDRKTIDTTSFDVIR